MIKGRKEVAVDCQLKGKIFLLDICCIYFIPWRYKGPGGSMS